MAKMGDAVEVLLVDSNESAVKSGVERLNKLLGKEVIRGLTADVTDEAFLRSELVGINSILSAIPYRYNLPLTDLAISVGANFCDMGGHTDTVWKQLERFEQAKDAGVAIVPDCGMGPGMNISMAVYAMSKMDSPEEVLIWDGGLPQKPFPPWNYLLTFNVNGLTNEYFGNAFFLRDGKVTEVPCFEGYEMVEFADGPGELEAFVTSGGLSTMPWSFEGQLKRLENKTVRYPGHCEWFKAYSELGLLELEPIQVGDSKVVPRDVMHALLEPKIVVDAIKDFCVIKVKCTGVKNGEPTVAVVDLIDHYDEDTGFTAMQRLTGWHASIVAILSARGDIKPGARPIEKAVPGQVILDEARLRGLEFTELVSDQK
jgi:lysine 6-dehydrogenase